MMRDPIGHAATRILREIEALVRIDDNDRQKPSLIVEDVRSVDWASLTFLGQRHEFDLRIEGECDAAAAALSRLVDELAEREIAISRQFVADIRVIPGDAHALGPLQPAGLCCQPVSIEALVLRD
jgi:hypothetical protein